MALNLVLVSGTREKLQMAAMIAAVSAVSGAQVKAFVSMNAIEYFLRNNAGKRAPVEGALGELMERKNAPPFMQLVQQAIELGGAKFYPCSMALDLLGITSSELIPSMDQPMGLTKFMIEASQEQLLVF